MLGTNFAVNEFLYLRPLTDITLTDIKTYYKKEEFTSLKEVEISDSIYKNLKVMERANLLERGILA